MEGRTKTDGIDKKRKEIRIMTYARRNRSRLGVGDGDTSAIDNSSSTSSTVRPDSVRRSSNLVLQDLNQQDTKVAKRV